MQGKRGGLQNCRKINKNLEKGGGGGKKREEKENANKERKEEGGRVGPGGGEGQQARSMRMSPLSRGKLYQFCRDNSPAI